MKSSGFTQKNAKLLFRALKDVNLTINKGERGGIIGPNGFWENNTPQNTI